MTVANAMRKRGNVAPVDRISCIMLTLLLITVTVGADDFGVKLNPWEESPAGREKLKGMTKRTRRADFHLGPAHYGIAYKAAYDSDQPDKAFPIEGYIGMPRPTSCNWYHSGFLFIRVNGKDIGHAALSSMVVAEQKPRAIVDMVWHHDIADVRARFVGIPESDHIIVEIAIDPNMDVKNVTVRTRCYPSFFTAWHDRVGARRIKTPARIIKQGQNVTATAKDNWWAVYYDEVFDVKKGEGQGPCALMVNPKAAEKITFKPGGYAVGTKIRFPADTRTMRLAFWEFDDVPNAEALKQMAANAASYRRQLMEGEFTPAAVSEFDVEQARQRLASAAELDVVDKKLKKRINNIKTVLAECAGQIQGRDTHTIAVQERILQSAEEYRKVLWRVKLAELLSEI